MILLLQSLGLLLGFAGNFIALSVCSISPTEGVWARLFGIVFVALPLNASSMGLLSLADRRSREHRLAALEYPPKPSEKRFGRILSYKIASGIAAISAALSLYAIYVVTSPRAHVITVATVIVVSLFVYYCRVYHPWSSKTAVAIRRSKVWYYVVDIFFRIFIQIVIQIIFALLSGGRGSVSFSSGSSGGGGASGKW